MRFQSRTLFILVGLLLLQLFLRAHHPTLLPYFIDEDNHIHRSAAFRHLEQHPAQLSHGKFFFYFLLAVVDLKERDTALHLARTMVALSSLLTSALIFVVVKRFVHQYVALLAVAFYALVPYAFFYERMALADPWAGTLGALTLWQSLRFASKPTFQRAAIVGVCAAVTVAAKLTMSFVVGFPVLALLFFAEYESLMDAIKRYMPKLILSGVVFVILWIPVLIPARLSLMNDDPADDFILVNTELVEQNSPSLADKVSAAWTKSATMTAPLMALLVVGLIGLSLWQRPRVTGFLLLCLVLAWLPSIVIVQNLQTRYLMSGVPIIAMLFGIASNVPLERSLNLSQLKPTTIYWGVAGLVLVWGMVFSLPFARTLMSNPPEVQVPALDEQNYFWDRYNGYGNREAMAYLQQNGERYENAVWVFPLTKVCNQVDLDPNPNVHAVCMDGYYKEVLADIDWQNVVEPYLMDGIPVYILTSEQSDVPPLNANISWDKVAEFPKPRHQQTVMIWRLQLDN